MNSREALMYAGGIVGAIGIGFALRGCTPTSYTYAEWAAMEARQTIVAAGQGLPPVIPELPPPSTTTSTEFLPLGPSATAAPTPRPEPTDLIYGSPTPTAISDRRPGESDIFLADSETKEISEGCVVRGDIEPVENERRQTNWHDDEAGTALVTIFQKTQAVNAPWGASGICTNPDDEVRMRELAESLLDGDTGTITRYPSDRGQGE